MNSSFEHAPGWRTAVDRWLSLDEPRLMGILNVTPDSFSDGGAYPTVEVAVTAAIRMKEAGAAIIDVGGESTRPGSMPVDSNEQVRRTAPVIEGIRKRLNRDDLLISIDTTHSDVARTALDAGADAINDTSAGRDDPDMLLLAAARRCGIVLMHRLRPPAQDAYSTAYQQPPDYEGDVVGAVRRFLGERCTAAEAAGIEHCSIVIDPGLGFGKSVDQNYELAGRIGDLSQLGYAVLGAASRKSFVGAPSGDEGADPKSPRDPAARLAGTIALHLAMLAAGVRLFRVHDVAEHRQAFAVARRSLGWFRAGVG